MAIKHKECSTAQDETEIDKFVHLTKEYSDFLQLAAAHTEDAQHGRGSFGKAYAMESYKTSVRLAYNISSHKVWYYFIILVIIMHCLQLFYLDTKPYYIAMEVTCVLCYMADISLYIILFTPKTFFSFTKTTIKVKLLFILTCLFAFDLFYTLYFYLKSANLKEIPIPFHFLRPAVFIIKIKTIYHIFVVVIKTFVRILSTLLAILLFVLFFSCVAVHLFGLIYEESDDPVYSGQFSNVGLAFIRLFVLITTENFPDVMLPAYNYHPATIIYFVVFIYVGVFILLSILLAIVVDNYWTIAKVNVKAERLQVRKELAIAWNLLADGAEQLSVEDRNLLAVFKMLKPENNEEETKALLRQFTSPDRSVIDYKAWLTRALDVLDLEVERPSEMSEVRSVIHSAFLQRCLLLLLLLHAVLIAVYRTGDTALERGVQWLRVGLSCLFTVEVVVRFVVLCYPRHMINRKEKVVDMVCVLLGTLSNCLWFYLSPNLSPLTLYISRGGCVVSSTLLFLFTFLLNSAEARKLLALLKLFLPVIADLTALFFICLFSFASLGETIFTASVHKAGGDSCGEFGFGSQWCSCVTLFQISTTSNWHDIMQRMIQSEAGYGGTAYFIVTYVVLHMVIINLFVAISYEAYNKFVSKPRQTLRKAAVSMEKAVSRKGRVKVTVLSAGRLFKKFTAGNRQSVSPAQSTVKRSSVTLRRKSIRGIRQKRSDDSLVECVVPIDTLTATGRIEVPIDPSEASLTPSRERKQKQILKEKMLMRNAARKMRGDNSAKESGVVVREYTAQGDEELSLIPGQTVSLLHRIGTKCKGSLIDGPDAGKTGWFPAYVIRINTAPTKTSNKSGSSPKLIKKQTTDWTKDIIGPMTLMNAEELKELNKILKANARKMAAVDSWAGREVKAKDTSLTGTSEASSDIKAVGVRERGGEVGGARDEGVGGGGEVRGEKGNSLVVVMEEEETVRPIPEVVVRKPSHPLLQETQLEQDSFKLQSPKVAEDSKERKKRFGNRNNKQMSAIPDWAQKFMTQSNSKLKNQSNKEHTEVISNNTLDSSSAGKSTAVELPHQEALPSGMPPRLMFIEDATEVVVVSAIKQ